MSLLRANATSLLTVGLLQAAFATSLVQSGPLLDALPSGRVAPAWPLGFGEPASLLALLAPPDRAAAETTEPQTRRIAAEQAVPPFAMFLVDTFGRHPSELPSAAAPR